MGMVLIRPILFVLVSLYGVLLLLANERIHARVRFDRAAEDRTRSNFIFGMSDAFRT